MWKSKYGNFLEVHNYGFMFCIADVLRSCVGLSTWRVLFPFQSSEGIQSPIRYLRLHLSYTMDVLYPEGLKCVLVDMFSITSEKV